MESLRTAEADASRAMSTEKALKAEPAQPSWWPKMSFWSNAATPTTPAKLPNTETKE